MRPSAPLSASFPLFAALLASPALAAPRPALDLGDAWIQGEAPDLEGRVVAVFHWTERDADALRQAARLEIELRSAELAVVGHYVGSLEDEAARAAAAKAGFSAPITRRASIAGEPPAPSFTARVLDPDGRQVVEAHHTGPQAILAVYTIDGPLRDALSAAQPLPSLAARDERVGRLLRAMERGAEPVGRALRELEDLAEDTSDAGRRSEAEAAIRRVRARVERRAARAEARAEHDPAQAEAMLEALEDELGRHDLADAVRERRRALRRASRDARKAQRLLERLLARCSELPRCRACSGRGGAGGGVGGTMGFGEADPGPFPMRAFELPLQLHCGGCRGRSPDAAEGVARALRELIRRYPDSPAARHAWALLDQLGSP